MAGCTEEDTATVKVNTYNDNTVPTDDNEKKAEVDSADAKLNKEAVKVSEDTDGPANDNASENEVEPESEKVTISEEELEQLQGWFNEYKPPLKGKEAEILQLCGNLDLNMDESCYPELRESLRQYREQAESYAEDPAYRVIVHRADTRALSFLERKTEDSAYQGYNFDPETGQNIELASVVKDMERLNILLENQLRINYPDLIFEENLSEKINQLWNNSSIAWTIGYRGLYICFPSEAVTFEEGKLLQVMVDFKNTPELFAEKYRAIPESYAIELDNAAPFLFDNDLDKSLDWAKVFNQDSQGYLLHIAENRDQIIIYQEGDLDFSGEYSMYAIEKDEIEYLGSEYIYLYNNRITDPLSVRIINAAEPILSGILQTEAYCSIAENGFFEKENVIYYYTKDKNQMQTLIPLEVSIVDYYTGEPSESNVTLLPDTFMLLLRTDLYTWCDFVMSDGRICRIEFDESAENLDIPYYNGHKILGECLNLKYY